MRLWIAVQHPVVWMHALICLRPTGAFLFPGLAGVASRHMRTITASQVIHASTITDAPQVVEAAKARSTLPGEWDQSDWLKCFRSQPLELEYTLEQLEIEGAIPEDLQGTFVNLGPGLFERGGVPVKSWLDGDGQITTITFGPPDVQGGAGARRVHVKSKFVHTHEFDQEAQADTFLYRGQFGTRKRLPPSAGVGGRLLSLFSPLTEAAMNALDTTLKNPSNTRVTYWGGKLLTHFEAALPYEVDPRTLETKGVYTFDGLLREGQPVTSDDERLKPLLEATGGHAFTAHSRVDPRTGHLLGWSWRTVVSPGKPNGLEVTFFEWAPGSFTLVAQAVHVIEDCVAPPHDFIFTDDYYVFMHYRFTLDMAPFLLGLKGPAECMVPRGEPAVAHLIPRPTGKRAGSDPIRSEVDGGFMTHWSNAFQERDTATGGEKVVGYACGWGPDVLEKANQGGKLFGDLIEYAPDFAALPPLQLHRLEVPIPTSHAAQSTGSDEQRREGGGQEWSAPGTLRVMPHMAHYESDFPKVHPSWQCRKARHLYVTACNDQGTASPPQGYLHLDLETGEVSTWYAGPRRFVGEGFLVTPTHAQQDRQAQEEEEEELQAYWVGTVHDGDTSSVLVFHAGPRLREGPICTLKLRHRMPWGIHADFVPEQLGG